LISCIKFFWKQVITNKREKETNAYMHTHTHTHTHTQKKRETERQRTERKRFYVCPCQITLLEIILLFNRTYLFIITYQH
jgi:hypothetical protein